MTDRKIYNNVIFSVSLKHIALISSNFGIFHWPKNEIEFQSVPFLNSDDGGSGGTAARRRQ